jgi:hypothetical protein
MKHGDHSAPTSLLPLFAEAAKARNTDPESSREAARHASNKLRESQEAVLRLFHVLGEMTDEQLVEQYTTRMGNYPGLYPPQTPSGLRTRRHELVEQMHIVYTGERDNSVPDRRVKPRIWRLTAEAKSA